MERQPQPIFPGTRHISSTFIQPFIFSLIFPGTQGLLFHQHMCSYQFLVLEVLHPFCSQFLLSFFKPYFLSPETRRLLQPSGAIVNLDVWHQLFHRQGYQRSYPTSISTLKHNVDWFRNLPQECLLSPARPLPIFLCREGSQGGKGAGFPKILRSSFSIGSQHLFGGFPSFIMLYPVSIYFDLLFCQVSRLSATTFKGPNNRSH